jgi:glutamine synthetase adenylyltransferase
MLQLKFGHEYRPVRTQNTYQALEALNTCDLVDEDAFRVLEDGLYFLKKLENMLRLLHGGATSELYESDFRKLALELNTKGNGEKLKETYISKTKEIRRIYERYFS